MQASDCDLFRFKSNRVGLYERELTYLANCQGVSDRNHWERIKVFEGIGWIGKRVSILILAEIAIMTKPIFCLEVGFGFFYTELTQIVFWS
ncbi:MAG: hypothetical protein BRC47_02525 [Cyanobacteria bacterium QS_7_48_42]|nr:MAG: hypothetical protein BRC47_02525 [Cyanobacteria bacterium QS_7_48_42]